jgi:hypothetical protein
MANGTSRQDPTLTDSLMRVIEAGQRLILDRLDLAYFDLSQLAVRTLHGAVLIVLGAMLLSGAWFTLLAGVVVWLHQYLTLPSTLLLVAGVNAVLGAVAIVIGGRRTQTTAAAKLGDMVADLRGSNTAAVAHELPAPERAPQ